MSFTETLQSITGKLLADCTDQELYLALLELVRQKSADRVQPVTGRKLYYISAEFLIGKLLSNNLLISGPRVRVPGGAPDIERQIVRFGVLFCYVTPKNRGLHGQCTVFARLAFL